MARFQPSLSIVSRPLRDLMKEHVDYVWSTEADKAFNDSGICGVTGLPDDILIWGDKLNNMTLLYMNYLLAVKMLA